MKNVLLVFCVIPLCMLAQNDGNPCAQIEKLYGQKVEVNVALKAQIENLRRDSMVMQTSISRLRQDTILYRKQLNEISKKLSQTVKHLKDVQQQLGQCRKKSEAMQNKINDRKSMSLQQYKDSVNKLNANVAMFVDSIGKLHTSVVSLRKVNKKQKNDLKQLNAIVELLSKRYENTSVDELFSHYDKGELLLYKDLCPLVGKNVSVNVEQTIICHRAQDQLKLKYDKYQVEQIQRQLSLNARIGKELSSRLQRYGTTNNSAFELWQKIKEDVYSEVVENSNFAQTEAKRATWYRTQKFLNQYPTLAEDYPYIYAQLQKMLRQVWDNPNNFNKINNPFE